MATIDTVPRNRLTLVVLIGLAVLLTYVDRGAIGIAAPQMKGELGLSATGFGIAVSAFFWIYVPACLFAGWLCDRFSVYRMMSLGVALWALATLLTGFAGGLIALVILRIGLGMGESIVFPAASKLIAAEISSEHRGSANAVVAAGIAFGPAVGTLAGGALMTGYGWRAMFIVFGAATLLWLLPWRRISTEHLARVAPIDLPDPVPFRRLVSNPVLRAMGMGQFFTNYGFYFLLSWMPLYLVNTRGYSIAEMTGVLTLGFAVQGVGALLGGRISDRMVRGGADEGALRKQLLALGHILVASSIAGIYLSGSIALIGFWLALAGLGSALLSTNVYALAQIYSGPHVAGSWVGVQNAMANTAGIIGPILTGVIVDRLGSYGWAFVTAAVIAAVGAFWWMLMLPKAQQISFEG